MFRVDVDAHVDESEATWEYLDDGERRLAPLTLDPGTPTAPGDVRPHRLWVIDGNIRLRRWRDDKRTGTVKATRELLDVEARVRHMQNNLRSSRYYDSSENSAVILADTKQPSATYE